jgi:imidazolonepropionase-like amidohydrolase
MTAARYLLLVLAVVLMGAALPAGAQAADQAVVAVVNVNVIPMTADIVIPNATVLITDGYITAVGDAGETAVPANAVVIEGRGRYLMPGLADMHAHISPPDPPATTVELLMYLATGVTTLRNMAGFPGDLALRAAIAKGEVPGPRLMLASPLIEGKDAVWDWATKALTEEEGRAAVQKFAGQGYDVIKIYHTLSPEVYEAIIDEARQQEIRVVGHVPFTVGIEEVLAAGQSSVEHLRGYDIDGLSQEVLAKDGGRSPERFASWLNMSDARMAELARKTAEAGTFNTPTLVVNQMLANAESLPALAKHPMAHYFPPDVKSSLVDSPLLKIFSPESRQMLTQVLPAQYKFIKTLRDAGAPLMAGTDTRAMLVPGYTLLDEIEHFVNAGLSNYEALAAATVVPARYIGAPDANGTVTAGQRADLILLEANPLDDISHLWSTVGVLVNGEWHPKSDLLQQVQDLLQAPNQEATDSL